MNVISTEVADLLEHIRQEWEEEKCLIMQLFDYENQLQSQLYEERDPNKWRFLNYNKEKIIKFQRQTGKRICMLELEYQQIKYKDIVRRVKECQNNQSTSSNQINSTSSETIKLKLENQQTHIMFSSSQGTSILKPKSSTNNNSNFRSKYSNVYAILNKVSLSQQIKVKENDSSIDRPHNPNNNIKQPVVELEVNQVGNEENPTIVKNTKEVLATNIPTLNQQKGNDIAQYHNIQNQTNTNSDSFIKTIEINDKPTSVGIQKSEVVIGTENDIIENKKKHATQNVEQVESISIRLIEPTEIKRQSENIECATTEDKQRNKKSEVKKEILKHGLEERRINKIRNNNKSKLTNKRLQSSENAWNAFNRAEGPVTVLREMRADPPIKHSHTTHLIAKLCASIDNNGNIVTHQRARYKSDHRIT